MGVCVCALFVNAGERMLEALDPASGERLWSVSTGSDTIEVPLAIVAARWSDGGSGGGNEAMTYFGAGSSVLAIPPPTLKATAAANHSGGGGGL
jgi:hypothetical protein